MSYRKGERVEVYCSDLPEDLSFVVDPGKKPQFQSRWHPANVTDAAPGGMYQIKYADGHRAIVPGFDLRRAEETLRT